jgi:transposase
VRSRKAGVCQAHDGQIADTLLNQLGPHTIVLADKAYDADRIRQLIQDHGAMPNIPPKSNRCWKPCFSRRLYRERNLTERFPAGLTAPVPCQGALR